jgi:adenosylcobinamide kinase/adenosylcobinamide-phosphate guanylyltransferase
VTGGIVLVGGGVRSGKSTFALVRARQLGARRALIATALPIDDEMRVRIAAHRTERAGELTTIEEPRAVPEALAAIQDMDAVVLDCLTLWLSNLLVAGQTHDAILGRVRELAQVMLDRPFPTIVVTNEVGMGLVPQTPLGRQFRDVAGRAHQILAARAREIYFAALGTIVRLAPAPLAMLTPGERE